MAQCPRCGASYDEEPGLASCPACLLRLGLEAPKADGEAPTEPAAAPVTAPGEPMPERIGDYTVVELLGTGGMGAVYLAEQGEPIHRRVAVKVIKAGLCTPEVLARFEAEREALALMSHPAIAAVLDAGTTDDGRPFVVMEYVPGIRITDYCDRHRLDLRHRLELFREVCSAVQHAHQKGIVHRDLKPNNVLVAEDEGLPRVKVIDFGLAKALHGRLTDVTLVTQFGMLLGTPAYMSPEQVQPSPLDVDTRTDVYSLGVLLYELLTGALPFDPAGVREEAVAELRHLLLELEPTRPSQRLQALGVDAVELAQLRNTDVGSLRRLLRDDLDWIVLRALERDRSRRYQSASELAADIDRHLKHEPVSAGPPSALYRIRKLARRHRTTAVAGALAVVALVSGAIGSGVLFVRAEKARQEADGHRRVAEWRGYVAEIAAADASLRIGSVAEARRHLELCPVEARGWEWRHLAMKSDASIVHSRTEEGQIADLAETPSGEFACVVVPPLYDEVHRAAMWLFDPGRDTWRRAAIQESVLAVSPDGARAVTTPWWFGGELGSNAPPTAPVPASERGLLRLVDTDSLAPRATFHLPAAGRWTEPADRTGPEPRYYLTNPVRVTTVFRPLKRQTLRLEGHYPETVSAVIGPNGKILAAWSWDNTMQTVHKSPRRFPVVPSRCGMQPPGSVSPPSRDIPTRPRVSPSAPTERAWCPGRLMAVCSCGTPPRGASSCDSYGRTTLVHRLPWSISMNRSAAIRGLRTGLERCTGRSHREPSLPATSTKCSWRSGFPMTAAASGQTGRTARCASGMPRAGLSLEERRWGPARLVRHCPLDRAEIMQACKVKRSRRFSAERA